MMDWSPLKYHETQQAYFRSLAKFVFCAAGRGSGKTELVRRKLVLSLGIRKPWRDPLYFYASPTWEQTKKLAWEQLLGLIPKVWILGEPNISELTITTIFGSRLMLFGLDRPQRAEGLQYDGGAVDESSDVKEGVIDKSIKPALIHRNGWLYRIGVPKRTGVGVREFRKECEKAAKDMKTSAFYTWKTSDVVGEAQLRTLRESMDTVDALEQLDGAWQTPGGEVYHAFDKAYNVRPCSYHPELAIVVGSDFNVSPMAWVLCHRIGDTLEVFDELFINNTNTQKTLDTLRGRYPEHRNWQFYGDATGASRKTSANTSDYVQILNDPHFTKMGRTVHYPHSNPPVADRFAATNVKLCSANQLRTLFISPTCTHLIDDLTYRHYKPGTTEVDDSGELGHATDALGYILHYLWPLRHTIVFAAPTVGVAGGK